MTPNFCLTCSQPLHKQNDTDYTCANGHNYWNGPHCGVSVIFMHDGYVLAAKRGIEPHLGQYSWPGGFLNHMEQPEAAARREMLEETGVEVGSLRLLDAKCQPYSDDESAVSIVFLAEHWQGVFKAGDDAAHLDWRPIDFIESDAFAWHYPGLADKLRAIDAERKRHD